jgi:phosphoglycolate phosphatase-like HAD superfamily hydrolase
VEAANKKLIIFDFDGVFNLNSMEAYHHCYRVALEEGDVSMAEEDQSTIINRAWGSSHRDIIAALLPPGDNRYSDVVRAYEEILGEDFAEIINGVPGAPQMLERLAGRFSLALNTAADPEVLLEQVMPKVGIEPGLFHGGMVMALNLIGDEYARPKPFPDTTQRLMERNGVQPHETVMVGDSHADIQSAIEAGIDDIAVPLTGQLTRVEAQEFNVEILPDVTHLEALLGIVCTEDYVEVNSYA